MKTNKEFESPFDIREMFYSKTNLKGIITSGNAVFVRVSEFSEAELLKQPHNIIRHQDMPRTVFKLFWNFLKDNRPVAAYVKNRSKTGRFYWVFAMAFPLEDGYLSIRLKPTSLLFSHVKDIYAAVLKLEESGVTLEKGIEILGEHLRSHGFSSYEEFMKMALIEELHSRDKLLINSKGIAKKDSTMPLMKSLSFLSESCATSAFESFTKASKFFEKVEELLNDSRIILEICERIKYLTINLTIASAKLGDLGKPLCIVAGNLEKLTDEIIEGSIQFERIFASYKKSVFDMYFDIAISRFQIEMMWYLADDGSKGGDRVFCFHPKSLSSETSLLTALIAKNFENVSISSASLIHTNRNLLAVLESLSKFSSGMEVIHIVAKIEMSRSREATESLAWRLTEMGQLMTAFRITLSKLASESSVGLTNSIAFDKINENLAQRLSTLGKGFAERPED